MRILSSVSPSTISETELLSFLTSYASANDYPFALWKLPGSETRNLLIANDHRKTGKGSAIEDLPPGFIFSPFDQAKDPVFLPADFLFRFENSALKPADDALTSASEAWLEKNYDGSKGKFRQARPEISPAPAPLEGPDDFLKLIRLSLEEIKKGTFEKIVPSRTMVIDLPANFDLVKAFEKLCYRYSQAMISFVNIPGIGCWLGATPEMLVSVEDKSIFKTVALAGTQEYREGMNLRNVAWTQKEIEEQALVERYVISCFKKIRLREYEEHGPKTSVAGNLIHLKSDFTVDMRATNFPQLGTVMLELLHPTSAVCGMPLEPAIDFLKKNEHYDRSFYAGYLGPVNVDNDIHIFVNLRCMQLMDKQAILYAGAGVTIDSDPMEEYEETEIKFDTLLNVLT